MTEISKTPVRVIATDTTPPMVQKPVPVLRKTVRTLVTPQPVNTNQNAQNDEHPVLIVGNNMYASYSTAYANHSTECLDTRRNIAHQLCANTLSAVCIPNCQSKDRTCLRRCRTQHRENLQDRAACEVQCDTTYQLCDTNCNMDRDECVATANELYR